MTTTISTFIQTVSTIMFDIARNPIASFSLRVAELFAITLICLVMMASISSSQAASSAERFVGRVGAGVLAAANAGSVGQFRSILRRHADLRVIARFSLGKYARRLPPRQRGEVKKLVEGMITKAFATYSDRLRGTSVEVTGSVASGRYGTVVSTKVVGGSGGEIKWRLAKSGGSFRVIGRQRVRRLAVAAAALRDRDQAQAARRQFRRGFRVAALDLAQSARS